MNFHKMRHAVDIQQKTIVQDPVTGATTPTWTTLHANVLCSIEPMSVKNFMEAKAEQSGISVRIVMRYRSGLDATMRFVGKTTPYTNNIYNPEGILPDPKSGQEWLTFPCSEGINQG